MQIIGCRINHQLFYYARPLHLTPMDYTATGTGNSKSNIYRTSTMHTRRCKHTPPPYPAEAVS